MNRRGISFPWLFGAGALWVIVAAGGVWFFAPIYMWICDDCGTPAPGASFGPGEQHIVWEPTLIAAAIVATVVTLAVTGVVAFVRRSARRSVRGA